MRLFEQGVVMDYRQYKQARKRYEASSNEFAEAIATNTLDLSDTERNEQNLQTILQRNALSDMVDE
jgi:DNA-binding transcriptional regulator YiaG